jgi:diguanylate cyclase (GGDEF)-like protein
MMRILCDRVERLTACLANESLVDDLTGLNNKKGFCRALEQEWHRAKRSDETLVMGVLDVCLAGSDACLENQAKNSLIKAIGDTLSATVRRCDLVSRIDTDTFVVLISQCRPEGIRIVIDRLKKDLQHLQNQYETAISFSLAFKAAPVNMGDKNDGGPIFDATLDRLKTGNPPPWSFTTAPAN